MSAGTPYLVGHGNAASGTTFCQAPVTHSTAVGDTIAVWITSNASSNNLSSVSDSQGNTYAAQGAASAGTSANGQWFVAGPSNNPGGPAALTAGADDINGNYTGTGGTKTVQAVGCSGLTGAADENSGPEHGTGTSISYTTPATNQNGDLMLAAETHPHAGGTPVTWGGSLTGPTLTDNQAPAATYANVAALVQGSAGVVTTTITLPSSANWAAATITLLAATSGPPASGARVGATIPNLAFGAGCYDQGQTQAAADTAFCTFTGRGIGASNSHLSVTKKFWTGVNDYNLGKNDLVNYAAFGTKVLFALTPPYSGGTAADQTALANFLTGIKALGFTSQTACIILWQEPEGGLPGGGGPKFPGGPAQYATQLAFFGPTVNASGLPLAQDVGMGGGVLNAENWLNAGYGAGGVTYQAQYADFYFAPFNRGVTLDGVAAIADSNGVPFGLGEYGCHVTDNFAAYFSYITHFFQTRLSNFGQGIGTGICDLEYYQGQCSPTGAGDLTSPILSATDPRVGPFQTMFDTLSSIPSPNTVTVTNPGNQTGTAGVAIAPLTVTATDSDPSQTLTFTAAGLPTGLAISTAGVVSGTPTTQGVYNVTVTATDGTGASGSTGFSWNISPVVTNTVTVTSPGAQKTALGAQVSLTISATDSNGADGPPFTWGASGLPPGLTIGVSTGTVSGNPTTVGLFSVTVTATDSIGSAGSVTFSWQITNPNVLPHGQFTTLAPIKPSSIAGLGPAQQLSYELSFGLVAGASSTQPFAAVTLQFYDFDALPALQQPVATVTYRCPMGTVNDPNGPAVTSGRGPMRGAFMRARINNTDTVDATLANFQLVGTAREVNRDDWRWDCGGNAPVIPTFTNATAATSSLVLAGISNATLAASASLPVLCSMFAGQVYLRVHYGGTASSVNVQLAPEPSALFSSQSIFNQNVTTGNELTATIAVPRGPCLLTLKNNDGANSATSVFAELIAIET